MMMPGAYGKATLNDNWFEDRFEPASARGDVTQRTLRPVETDLAYIGERYDVLNRIGRMPHKLTYAIPDDGFRERTSIAKADFGDPKSHPTVSNKRMETPRMINTANAPVLPPERRPVHGPESGFGAALPRHPKTMGQRFWNTTSGDFYGYGASTPRGTPRVDPVFLGHAGGTTERLESRVDGVKCGRMCGEDLRETSNPALDTRTQRAWMPGGDPGLANSHLGGVRRRPPGEDNELSLPLGDGAMSKVRADLKERQGMLYRTATAITKAPYQLQGVKIFHDD